MKCNYSNCLKDIGEDFIFYSDDSSNMFFHSVSCFLSYLLLQQIQVWGYSEGLGEDYMSKEDLKFFKDFEKEYIWKDKK